MRQRLAAAALPLPLFFSLSVFSFSAFGFKANALKRET